MRWYSVKKYKPPIKHAYYMVRTTDSKIHVATLEGSEELCWIDDEGRYFDDYPITHFCIPDPIEIEE